MAPFIAIWFVFLELEATWGSRPKPVEADANRALRTDRHRPVGLAPTEPSFTNAQFGAMIQTGYGLFTPQSSSSLFA